MTYRTNSKGIKISIFGVAAVAAGFYVDPFFKKRPLGEKSNSFNLISIR